MEIKEIYRLVPRISNPDRKSPEGTIAMSLPNAFKRIRLNLARSKDFPEGSARHGYEFVAPLDAQGHIDQKLWTAHRENCGVRRFWAGEEDRIGRLVHKPGGSEHARWVFDYNPARADDDEAGYRFGSHAFVPGEYVTLRDEDEEAHTFRVVSVEPAS
jgi:hypothetical protein